MTFQEATENINVLSSFSIGSGLSPKVVQDIINSLKQEYAPDITMNQSEYEMFSYYLDSYTFEAFLEAVHHMDTAVLFGVGTEMYFEDLTEEDLMSAWLHPNTVKVVE